MVRSDFIWFNADAAAADPQSVDNNNCYRRVWTQPRAQQVCSADELTRGSYSLFIFLRWHILT